jgi:hypothetical protein
MVGCESTILPENRAVPQALFWPPGRSVNAVEEWNARAIRDGV